jgi:DNA ligase-associated metallophosphoesterase
MWHTKSISFAGLTCELSTARCLYINELDALILSDLHLGKSAHLRKHGLHMPNVLHQQDMDRLKRVIPYYNPKQVFIVGDLLHAGSNKEWEDFKAITVAFENIEFILIKGNHDLISSTELHSLGIHQLYSSFQLGPILLQHEPTLATTYSIGGHIHPGVQVKMPFKKHMRFPCFALVEQTLILPAFSAFTGLDTKSLKNVSRYHAFHDGGFFEIKK